MAGAPRPPGRVRGLAVLPDPTHQTRLSAGAAGHWFHDLCVAAEVPNGSLHRLRHSVATFLVGQGELLRAQQRLGHRDPSTTLRNYTHALPLEDEDVADDLDDLLEMPPSPPGELHPFPRRRPVG